MVQDIWLFFILFLFMSILSACLYVCCVCDWCPRKSQEDAGFPGTEVTDGLSYHVGAGNWKLGHLQEQQVFLTSEPSSPPLQP